MASITIRRKKLEGGKYSLYLNYYHSGTDGKHKTIRKYLKLYGWDAKVYKKANNRSLPLELVEQTKTSEKKADVLLTNAKNEQNKPDIYNPLELQYKQQQERLQSSFLAYFERLANKRKKSNSDNWMSAFRHLKSFRKEITFADFLTSDPEKGSIADQLKEHLQSVRTKSGKPLAINSQSGYFNKVKAALKQAYKDGILTEDVNRRIERIEEADPKKEHFTFKEVEQLINAPCGNDEIKRASIFAVLTGLRFSDVQNLRWENIDLDDMVICKKIKKTKTDTTKPLNPVALKYMGEPNAGRVFPTLQGGNTTNNILRMWQARAGIDKQLTFHSFRHTFATHQVELGTDLVTLMKLLDHTSIKSTMRYAKTTDELQALAVNKVNYKGL